MNRYQQRCIALCMLMFGLSGGLNLAAGQSVSFGIVGGPIISSHLKNFHYSDSDGEITLDLKPNIATGFKAGFMLRNRLSSSLRLQAEPTIAMLGARYDEPFLLRGFEFRTDSRTELFYLQLPLLLQLTSIPPQKTVYGRQFAETTYHLSGGLYGGYLLNARFTGTNTGAPIGIAFEGDFSNTITSQYTHYDGGVILGAGFEYGIRRKIGFETRAQFSVFDTGNLSGLSYFRPQNMALTFSVYLIL